MRMLERIAYLVVLGVLCLYLNEATRDEAAAFNRGKKFSYDAIITAAGGPRGSLLYVVVPKKVYIGHPVQVCRKCHK